MKILLVTQYFHPENFKSNDIAFDMASRGHEVTVLTGIPDYPQGRFHDGYGIFRRRLETIDGVRVYRAFQIPRLNGGGAMLALNYLSWAFTASVVAFFMSLFRKYDAVIVHQTSPVTQGFPALVVHGLHGTPVYFWVLDLWPESLLSAGGINNRHILGLFEWITRLMYSMSGKILISSEGFRKSVLEKGRFEDKLVYFPNWAEDVFSSETGHQTPSLPDGFKVMFAGNVGEAQDMESVMKTAGLLKGSGVVIVIVGEGRKKRWVDDYIMENGLEDVVFMAGRHPLESMPSFFAKADVLFLSLKDEPVFSLTAPAKLQAYMASGKPIAAMINGEARELIGRAGCGLSCAAGDYSAFAECILNLKASSKRTLDDFGKNGRRYFEIHFRRDRCMDHLCRILEE